MSLFKKVELKKNNSLNSVKKRAKSFVFYEKQNLFFETKFKFSLTFACPKEQKNGKMKFKKLVP